MVVVERKVTRIASYGEGRAVNQRRVGFGLIEKASVVDNVTFLGHGWDGRRLLRGMRTA
jgi:hypothetical protein